MTPDIFGQIRHIISSKPLFITHLCRVSVDVLLSGHAPQRGAAEAAHEDAVVPSEESAAVDGLHRGPGTTARRAIT